ncbi:unnamed protein product [Camellia sinensis]
MKPSLTLSSGWALTSPNPLSSSKASMIVSIDSDCVGLSLNSWIAKVPGVLCDKVIQKWGITFPFMFKVLSVSKALSIQAHPDKEFAGFLHKTLPDVFKDDNYKPEMALALTEFEALCGFISLKADQAGTVVEVLAKDGKPVIARSQSDSDVEVFEAAEAAIEGGDLGIIGDDVFAFGDRNFSPAPGVETICFFPKNPLPSQNMLDQSYLLLKTRYLTGGGFGFSNSNFNVCGSLMCGGCMDNGLVFDDVWKYTCKRRSTVEFCFLN